MGRSVILEQLPHAKGPEHPVLGAGLCPQAHSSQFQHPRLRHHHQAPALAGKPLSFAPLWKCPLILLPYLSCLSMLGFISACGGDPALELHAILPFTKWAFSGR